MMEHTHEMTDVQDLKAFLQEGARCGVQLPKGLEGKLGQLDHNDGVLRVVLVGGFSVGKTSIAAAWLGKPRDDMKISQSESSSAVTVYEVDGGVQLVDTPGLFGFKEHNVGDGEAETYRDMTRKYVSEAGLLLYVLDPSNPIKDSHKEELHWLFRDLNLLSRTVFVLSQFDKIADLEDEGAFAKNLDIKKQTVCKRLDDLISLTKEEKEQLSIVAVSANPFEEGPDYWSRPENADEFRQLSHVGDLQQATEQMLEQSGGVEEVSTEMALSIVRDVVQRQMVPAVQRAEVLYQEARLALHKAGQESLKLNRFKREAEESRIALAYWVEEYFGDLVVQAQQAGRKDFAEFFERNIGERGDVLQRQIQLKFENETQAILGQLEDMTVNFRDSGKEWDWLSKVASGAGKLQQSGAISGSSILAVRDALGVGIKFKPWGAIGLASKLNVGLAAAGPIVEGIMILKKIWDEQKFQEQKQAIETALREQRDVLREMLDPSDFMERFFPQFSQMEAVFQLVQKAQVETERRFAEIRTWGEQGRQLCLKYGLEAPELPALPSSSDEPDVIDV